MKDSECGMSAAGVVSDKSREGKSSSLPAPARLELADLAPGMWL